MSDVPQEAFPEVLTESNGASLIPPNLKEHLLEERARIQAQKTLALALPRFGEALWVELRGMEHYTEFRAITKRNERAPDAATAEQLVALDTLIAASVDTFALMEGEKHSLSLPLGRALAHELGYDAESDRDAVLWLFDQNTTQIVGMFGEWYQWSRGAARGTDLELEGN